MLKANIKHRLAALAVGTFIASAAHADAVKGTFDILNGNASAPGGTVTFTLAANGTIAASLTATAGTIVGFGFNSVGSNLPESNFSPTAPDNGFGWMDLYGTQNSGFLCGSCGTTETWTIGNPGDFSSVHQALGGNTSSVDFFLWDSQGNQWGANAVAVPEPETYALMLLGLGAVGAVRRRRSR